jgi:hypothetical protein
MTLLSWPAADPDWASFQPAVCLGMQNFGGAEGYRAVYLGPPPCGRPGSTASQEVAWGSTAAFMLECRPLDVLDTAGQPATEGGSGAAGLEGAAAAAGGTASRPGARRRSLLTRAQLLAQQAQAQGAGVERQGAFSKLSSLLRSLGGEDAAGMSGRLACQAAVTSDAGRGAILQFGDPQGPAVLPYQGDLNAVQVRVCNT